MATNSAQKLAAYKAVLTDIKAVTNTPEYTKVALSKILDKHKVANETLSVLKNMGILGFKKEGKVALYQWSYGAGSLDEKLASSVYDGVKFIQNNRPNKKHKPLNPVAAVPVKKEEPKKAKVVATPLPTEKVKAPVWPGFNKATTDPALLVKKQAKEPVATPIPVSATPQPDTMVGVTEAVNVPAAIAKEPETVKVEAVVAHTPKKKKVKVVEQPLQFKDEWGVIFGYRQLTYLGKQMRDLPTEVLVDNNLTFSNVSMITYKVEKSNLAITFYASMGVKVGEIRMMNKVIGLNEHGGDTQSQILKITTIPVNDPFKIK